MDLSLIDSSKVINMNSLFNNCENLQDLNIPYFNTEKVQDITSIFDGCSKLEILNINSFVKNDYIDFSDLFKDIPEALVFCLKEKSQNQEIINILQNKNATNNCSFICNYRNEKIISENYMCIVECSQDNNNYIYEYNNICFNTCPNGTKSFNNQNLCIEYFEETSIPIFISTIPTTYYDITNISTTIIDVTTIPTTYYDIANISTTIIDVRTIPTTNYDKTNVFTTIADVTTPTTFIEISTTINIRESTLIIEDSTNPSEIKDDKEMSTIIKYINSTNEKTSNEIITTIIKETIPLTNEVTNFINLDSTSLIDSNNKNILSTIISAIIHINNNISSETCSSRDFLQKKCENMHISMEQKQNIINQIKEDIINGNIKDLLEDVINGEKKDLLVEEYNTIYQITSSYNQNNKNYNSISTIKLGECENKLRSKYNMSESDSLLIFKIDIYEEGLLMPIVEYEIYHPYTLEKLNLDICFENKIEISVPIINIKEEELYKYDMKSGYYKDKCFPSSNDNKVDLTISDRQNEYINNNLTLCENNCELNEYDKEIKKAICECEIKNEINIKSDLTIDKKKLLSKFIKIKSLVNIDIMKCYKVLFTKRGLIKNIGSYILLLIIFLYIILLFVFVSKGFTFFQEQIKAIILAKELYLKTNKTKNNHPLRNNSTFKKKKNLKNKTIPKRKKIKTKSNKNNEPPSKKKRNRKKNDYSDLSFFKHNTSKYSSQNNFKKKLSLKANNKIIIYKGKNPETKNNEKSLFFDLNDYELNSLSYNEAIKYDKRSYWQYYISLIRTKHLIFCTFCPNRDYNSMIIKICLFLFSFALYYTVNGLFFSDSTIHEIYEESGAFNFIYHLPQILYSTLISSVINITLKALSLSQNNILKIKKQKKIKDSKLKIKSVLNCLKIKFIIFFVLSFLFLILFWFYLSCFCAIYNNTQVHLIKDTLISFLLSLVYPFGINFLPGLFRIPSLRDIKNSRICLYKISKIIQLI